MHSSLKFLRSRKGQFFVLSAVAIVTVLVYINRLVQPFSIIDTSQVVLGNEIFLFNDVKEKAFVSVQGAQTCNDALFDLQEYQNFVQQFAIQKGYLLSFSFTNTGCPTQNSLITFNVNQTLVSSSKVLQSIYTISWP